MQWKQPPAMEIDAEKTYKLAMQTNRGLIEIELYAQHAPKTVNNFVFLARQGFYNGIKFHRVISNFMFRAAILPEVAAAAPVINSKMKLPVTR